MADETLKCGPYRFFVTDTGISITAAPEHIARIRDRARGLVEPSVGLRDALKQVEESAEPITSSELAHRMYLGIPNASNKLRVLWEQGYIQRRERCASSGGVEFEYFVKERP